MSVASDDTGDHSCGGEGVQCYSDNMTESVNSNDNN